MAIYKCGWGSELQTTLYQEQIQLHVVVIACENIRFSSLFAAGDVSHVERGETDVFVG